MRSYLEGELTKLKSKVTKMCSMAVEDIELSVGSLLEKDRKMAEKVIKNEEILNDFEVKIDAFCNQLLALHQPAADDLRFITSAMKIKSELERMGDLSVNIAQSSEFLMSKPLVKPLIDLPKMADLAQDMVHEAVDAFIKRDTKLACKVIDSDDAIDDLNQVIWNDLVKIINKENAERAIHLILIARYLERIADHATNIGEEVVYLVTGKSVYHQEHCELGGE